MDDAPIPAPTLLGPALPTPLLLTIDCSDGGACLALVGDDGAIGGHATLAAAERLGGRLPALAAGLLQARGIEPLALSGIAIVTGPGSFTGLRASIAFAQGLALAAGIPGFLLPVTLAEALEADLPPGARAGRDLWVATMMRRDHVTLARAGAAWSGPLDAIGRPDAAVAVAGDAAAPVAAWMAARGVDVRLTDARRPTPAAIAGVALARRRGERAALAPMPWYGEAPAVRTPAPMRAPPR